MEIKKALITAAGAKQRTLPLQTLVDRDGIEKTALRILVEESVHAGIEEICVVISPGDHQPYRAAVGDLAGRMQFVEQTSPLGYGHAVSCAESFVGDDPFLLLVSDHLYLSGTEKRCARQLVETASAHNCAVSAVLPTHESRLPQYGAAGGQRVTGRNGLYEIDKVIEKPTPTEAEQKLVVPGLRAGHYLCFFGMHVLTPAVMRLLAEAGDPAAAGDPLQLSAALNRLPERERYLASEIDGRRFDIGLKYGLLNAQLALALDGQDSRQVLSDLVELLAQRNV